MTDEQTIFDGLKQVLREHVGIEADVQLDSDLQTDLGLDSLQQLTFVVETENAFKICFRPEDEADLKTLGDITAYIAQLKRSAGAASQADRASA